MVVRQCYYCEKEFDIPNSQGVSHGVCKRHSIMLFDDPSTIAIVGKVVAEETKGLLLSHPDRYFCPDMSQIFDG
jgi:hypothetical protein